MNSTEYLPWYCVVNNTMPPVVLCPLISYWDIKTYFLQMNTELCLFCSSQHFSGWSSCLVRLLRGQRRGLFGLLSQGLVSGFWERPSDVCFGNSSLWESHPFVSLSTVIKGAYQCTWDSNRLYSNMLRLYIIGGLPASHQRALISQSAGFFQRQKAGFACTSKKLNILHRRNSWKNRHR